MIPPNCTSHKRRKPSHEETKKSPGIRSGRDRSKSGSYADQSSLEKPTVSSSSTKKTRKSIDAPQPNLMNHDSSYPISLEDVPSTEINTLHVIPQVNRLESLDEDNSLASSIFVDEQIMPGCNAHKNCIHETCMMELKAKTGDDDDDDKEEKTSNVETPNVDQQLFNQDEESTNPVLNMNDDGSTEGEEDCECGTKSVYNELTLEQPDSLGMLNREDTILVDQESQDESKKEDRCIQMLSTESSSISLQSHFATVKSESDMKNMVAESSKMTPSGSRSFKNLSSLKKRSESFKSRYLRSSSKLQYMRKSITSMGKYSSDRADCDQSSLDFGEESSKSASLNPSPAVEPEMSAGESMRCYNSPSFSDYFSDPNNSSGNNKASLSLESKDIHLKDSFNSDCKEDSSIHVYPLRSRLKREKLRKQLVARQSRPRTFNQLPYEILTRILHYLNIQDVFRMQRVSRRIKEIVESYLGMIKRINFTNGLPFAFLPSSLDDKTLKKILCKTPRITHILGFYPHSISSNTHDTSKHISGLSYAGIIDAFRCCTKMRSVEIMNVELMSHLVQYLPYVKFHGMFRNRPDLWDSEYAVKLPSENQNSNGSRPSNNSQHHQSIVALNTKSYNYVNQSQPGPSPKTGRSSLAQFAADYAHNAAIGASRQANLFEPQCELAIGEGCPSTSGSSANFGSLIVNGVADPDNIFAAVAARPVIPVDLAANGNANQQHQQQENFLQPLIVAPAIDAADWINLNNLNEIVLQQQNHHHHHQQQYHRNENVENNINNNWAMAAAINQQQQHHQHRPQYHQQQPPIRFPQQHHPLNINPNGQAAAAAAAVAAMLVMRQNPENNNLPRNMNYHHHNQQQAAAAPHGAQRDLIDNHHREGEIGERNNNNSNSNSNKIGKSVNGLASPLPSEQLIIPLPSVITSLTKLDLVSISINSLPRLDNIKYLHLKWVVFTSSDPFFHFSAPKLQSFVFNNCVGPSRFVRFVRIFAALSRATQLSRLELVGSRFVEGLIEHILDNYLSSSRNFRHLQRLILAGNKDVSEMDMGLLLIASQNSLVHVALQSGQSRNSLFEALTFSGIKLQKLESLILGYQDPYQSRLTISELNGLQLTESQDASMPICAVTNRGIRLAHNVCPKLLSLHLRHCPYLSDVCAWDVALIPLEERQTNSQQPDVIDPSSIHSVDDHPPTISPLKSLILESCPSLSLRSLERCLFEGKPYPCLDTLVLRDMFPIPPPSHGLFTSLYKDKESWSNYWSTGIENITTSTIEDDDDDDDENEGVRKGEPSNYSDYRILWLLLVIADSLSISRIGYPSLSPSGVGLGSSARDVSHFNSINTIRSNDSPVSSFEIFLSLRLHTYSSVLLQLIGGTFNVNECVARNSLVQDILLGRQPLLSLTNNKNDKRSGRKSPPLSSTNKLSSFASVGTQTCICSLLEVDAYLRLSNPQVSAAYPPVLPSDMNHDDDDDNENEVTTRTTTTTTGTATSFDNSSLAFHPFLASNQYNQLGELYKDQEWLDSFNSKILAIYKSNNHGINMETDHDSHPTTTSGIKTRGSSSSRMMNPRKRRATESIALRAKTLRVNHHVGGGVDQEISANPGICTRSKRKSFASSRELQILPENDDENNEKDETPRSKSNERGYIRPLSSYLSCYLCSGQLNECDNNIMERSSPISHRASFSSSCQGIDEIPIINESFSGPTSISPTAAIHPKSWRARDACIDTSELRCSPQSNCEMNVFTICQSSVNKATSSHHHNRIIQTTKASSTSPSTTSAGGSGIEINSIPQVIPTGPSNVLTTLHLEKVGLSHIVLGWLPRLKNLTVDCCPKLKGILLAPKDPQVSTIKSYVPSLRRVRIIRCPKFAIYNWLYTAAKMYPEHEENLFITYRPFGEYNKRVENTLWENATGAHVMVSNDFRHDQSERAMEEFHSNFDQLFREVMNFSEMLIRKNLIKVQHPEDSKYLTRTEHGVGWDLITDLPWIHEVCCSYLPCQHFCKNSSSRSEVIRPNSNAPSTSNNNNSSASAAGPSNFGGNASSTPNSFIGAPLSSSSTAHSSVNNSKTNLSNIRFDQVDQLYEILAEVKYQDWNRETQINVNQRNLGSFKIAKKGIHYHVQHRDIISSQEKERSIADWVHAPSHFTDYPYTDEYFKSVHPIDDYNVYSNEEAIHQLPPKRPIQYVMETNDDENRNDDDSQMITLQNLDSWQRLLLEQDEIKI